MSRKRKTVAALQQQQQKSEGLPQTVLRNEASENEDAGQNVEGAVGHLQQPPEAKTEIPMFTSESATQADSSTSMRGMRTAAESKEAPFARRPALWLFHALFLLTSIFAGAFAAAVTYCSLALRSSTTPLPDANTSSTRSDRQSQAASSPLESPAVALAQAIPDYEATSDDTRRVEYPDRPLHVILVATGSVASVKVPLMTRELLEHDNVRVQIIASKASLRFFDSAKLEQTHTGVNVWTDDSDWKYFHSVGDPILHIELRRWADLVMVAPCSANTLARMRSGAADSLATAVMLARNTRRTALWLFPAMNTLMWEHPIVQENLVYLQNTLPNVAVYNPIQKGLACGDDGIGAMMEWSDIVKKVVAHYHLDPKLPT